MITTHIIVQNDAHTIVPALQSVISLGPILIGDIGSNDGTIQLCRQFQAEIYRLPAKKARNTLLEKSSNDWNFFIHPWEVLAYGQKEILSKSTGSSFYIQIFQNDSISKEIRLWNKKIINKFHNPVFESLLDPQAGFLEESCLYSKPHSIDSDQLLTEIEHWKKNQSTLPEPYYYQAMLLLNQGKFKEFLASVDNYLFRKQTGVATVILKYYAAQVYMHFNDFPKSVRHLIGCIAVRPLMAEYWCLLGDIYYKTNDYKKALAFYENAIVLGRRRASLDEWPVEISKYKEYPEKMIASCKSMLEDSKDYAISLG